MLTLVSFLASAALAAFSSDCRPSTADHPTNEDLEEALRGTSGFQYGADPEQGPLLSAEMQLELPLRPEEQAFRPHEMLLRMDIRSVPDDLLLGILLAGATFEDPVEVARRLMAESSHDVTRLRESSLWERTKGVGTVGQARVIAALELARRVDVRSSFARRVIVTTPAEAVAALSTMSFGPDESLSALFLDKRRRLIGGRTLTIGSDSFTVVDPRQIFKIGIEMGASAILLAHNHPSGDPTPSSQDRDVTERVSRAGRILGIPLLDHIVLGADGQWTSFAEYGLLPSWAPVGPSWTAEP